MSHYYLLFDFILSFYYFKIQINLNKFVCTISFLHFISYIVFVFETIKDKFIMTIISVNFYLNNFSHGKKPEWVIQCYIRELGKVKYQKTSTMVLNLHKKILPKYWDKVDQKLKRSYPEHDEYNRFLKKLKEDIEEIAHKANAENTSTKFEDIKKAIYRVVRNTDDSDMSFFEVFDEYLKLKSIRLAKNSIKNYNGLKNQLLSYQDYIKKPITFDDLTTSFFDKMLIYFIEVKQYDNNYINKINTQIRTFLNWCTEREYTKNVDFRKFITSDLTYDTDKIALTYQDLMRLYNLDLTKNPRLDKVRDVFVFSCFIGFRFSDIETLEHKHIQEDPDGVYFKWWVRKRIVKTKKNIDIPILPQGLKILEKYKNNSTPLPVISIQNYNDYLKELCELAKIDRLFTKTKKSGNNDKSVTLPLHKLITTHVARKTCATYLSNNHVPLSVIQQITGHKNLKDLQLYLGNNRNVIEDEMARAWNTEPLKLVVNQ